MTVRWRLFAAIFLGVLALACAAAWIWWLLRPPVPGPLRLTKTTFSALPGWQTSDPAAALSAFLRSCAVLAKEPPSAPMGGAGYAGTAADWRPPCQAAQGQVTATARAFFRHWFVPVEIGAGGMKNGLFTGYYEPQLSASRSRHGRFQTPVYGVPADLVSVDLGAFRPNLRGERIAGRVDDNRLVPYATRADIDAHGLSTAPVLFYADDPVAVFFLHIQGSGRVRFDNGVERRVSYAAQNGQLYTPIGRALIERGALTRQDVSMQSIRAWLLAHPAAARAIMETDASYVFFKEEPIGDAKLGAKGAQGVPLTPGASVAVDTRLHVLGAPYYVAATLPDSKPLRSLLIAQDVGGAIRGPVRADIFFGFGKRAEQLAGGMKQHGRFYVLLPKSVAARLAPQTDYPAAAP
ncbi:MAG: murein transglycosylase A [Alphaproteobacteria bacterium]|nr:MltA domain-containing protein [Alphaproteobacteria bacterium]MDE2109630.1 murein transglycosylase A [Alphaproteobacteria bacterium]MDE2493050.1 murein transglycosylase A [Alphaproteobacteria bacterium]